MVAGVLAFALLLAGTSSTPIFGRDEARFSQAAREMLARGDAAVPTFAGEGRYHKPILIYWCTIASYRLLGVTERAARLPSNLAGALVIAVLAATARRRWGPGSGLLAGLLLAATPVFWLQAKACTADLVLLLPTLAVMLAFERLLAGTGGARTAAVFWAAMGVAVLAKGPIAPMWVLCTALALWAMSRPWRRWEVVAAGLLAVLGWWRLGPAVLIVPAAAAVVDLLRSPGGRQALARLRLGWGIPLALAITLPWAVAATIATDGAFLREAVGEHVVGRSFRAFESHGFFPGFYVLTAVVVAFPWYGPLLGNLRARRRDAGAGERYLVAWLVGPLVMLELVATKLVHYWMPSYPAGVLLLVGGLCALGRPLRAAGRVVLAAGGLALAAALLAAPFAIPLPSLLPPGIAAAAVLAAGTVVAAAAGGRRPVAAMAAAAGCSVAALLVVTLAYLPELGRHGLGPAAARAAVAEVGPDEEIVVFKPRDEEIYFYLPVDARTCREASCMAALASAGTGVLGVARSRDFDVLSDEWRGVRLEVAGRVTGLDVGRARWQEQVLFRARPTRPGGSKNGAGVDRRGGGP